MSRIIDHQISPKIESFLTHPREQAELAAQLPWWGWAVVALCMAFCGVLIWYFWPRKDRNANLPRDDEGRLIPPWQWEQKRQAPPPQGS